MNSAPLHRFALATALASAALAGTTMAQAPATDALITQSERSGFVKTGRYDEVPALCDAFARQWPDAVRCETFGTTPEGRPMKLLVVSTSGALTPEQAHARQLPVTLVQGGIHAGEIDGKDAGFWLLRELLSGKTVAGATPGVLDRQVLLFVPVFNVDGHENFRAWNRPNQRGPEEMGFRTTAQRYNLNRDYMKADSPEMQAMLRLINRWDPLVEMDLHVTDGAKFEHDVSVTMEPINSGDTQLRKAGRQLRDGLIEQLTSQGSLPLKFYPSFVESDNPASGFEDGVPTPRFSHGYFQLRNRFGVLIETHSWKDYPTRVRITRNVFADLLDQIARYGSQWQAVANAADQRSSKLGGSQVPLDYAASDKVRTIDFRGYAYTRTPSDISGGLMTRYDEKTPQIWKVPLRDDIHPKTSVQAPKGGYLIPVAWAAIVGPKLAMHGIQTRTLTQPVKAGALQAWRADDATFAATSVEGHQRLTANGRWKPAQQDLPAGTVFVPIAQPKARLLMGLLEPQAPDAYMAWGAFNNAFEQKEYMEDYVAEEEARKMLAADPALKAEFEKRLKDDPAFAKSPQQRLDFFYRRHQAYDPNLRRYPILRSDGIPQ